MSWIALAQIGHLLSGWETYFPLALRFVPASTDYLTSPKTPPPTQRHNHTPMFTHSLALSAIVSCPQKPIDWYCCCADSKNMVPIVYSKMDCLYRNALLPIHNSVSLTQVIQLYVFTTINIFPKLISNKQTHTSKFKKRQKKTQKSWNSSFKDKWTTTHTKKKSTDWQLFRGKSLKYTFTKAYSGGFPEKGKNPLCSTDSDFQ